MTTIMIMCDKCGKSYPYVGPTFTHRCNYRDLIRETISYKEEFENVTLLTDGTCIYHYGEEGLKCPYNELNGIVRNV